MYHLLGLILVAVAALAENKADSKTACIRSEVSSKSREYNEGDTLIEVHKQAMNEIPKAFKQGSLTQYSKVNLEIMQVKKENKAFTVKRITGFDDSEKSKLNVEYSVYNADKSTIVNILPSGTFDGLIKECRKVKSLKKMYTYYYNPPAMYVPAPPTGNVFYLNDPVRSQVLTPSLSFPQYTVNGGVVTPNWQGPLWSDLLVPFGPQNTNANPQNPQAYVNNLNRAGVQNANGLGQPALNLGQQGGALPGLAQAGGSTNVLGQGQSNAGFLMGSSAQGVNVNQGVVGQSGVLGSGALSGGSGQLVLSVPNSGYPNNGQTGYLGTNGGIKTDQDRGQSKKFDNNNMLRHWDKGGANPAVHANGPSTWGQSKNGRVNHLTDGDQKN